MSEIDFDETAAVARHAQLPPEQRRRVERFLTSSERARLKSLMRRREAALRPDPESAKPVLFARHSPRMSRFLSELVDESGRVRNGKLAPSTEAFVQRWIDASAVSISVEPSRSLVGVFRKWLGLKVPAR